MEWNNDLVIEFLDLYELESAIWNPQNPGHKDRNAVYDAWKRIQSSLSQDVSLKELKKKKDALMATYRKLAAKVKKTKGTGSATYEVYKPEWFAYEKMASFLHLIYCPRPTQNTEDSEVEHMNTSTHNRSSAEGGNYGTSAETDVQQLDNDGAVQLDNESEVREIGGPSAGKKRKPIKLSVVEKRMDEAYNFLKTAATKSNVTKGESELFCDLLCAKLKALDDETREIAMHEIDNLMFRIKASKRRQGNAGFSQKFNQNFNVQNNYSPQGLSPSTGSSYYDSPTLLTPVMQLPDNNISNASAENHNDEQPTYLLLSSVEQEMSRPFE